MTEKEGLRLDQVCIDFRFAQEAEERALEEGAYLIAHAGASYDVSVATEIIRRNPDYFTKFTIKDHLKCGVFTTIVKDDSEINHQRHMDRLGEEIHAISPGIHFSAVILPFDDARRERYEQQHYCGAAAIILGDPEILSTAVERLRQDGLIGKHDLIARPFNLSDHQSILDDLKVSLSLHKDPAAEDLFKIFIFDRDEDNAMILERKVKEMAQDASVQTVAGETSEAVA